jgi:hypothetical protein
MHKVIPMTAARRAIALLFACLPLLLPAAAEARTRRHAEEALVVVELYTAQGCATCPKANKVAAPLENAKNVLPLTFSVDYWDYLGWSDTLAKPEFTLRQRAYATRFKVREIYTPEVVVPGAGEAPALEAAQIDALVKTAADLARSAPRVRVSRQGTRLRVGAGPSGVRADVFLLRYDPQPVTVKVRVGENKGQTVTVLNAVRDLERLGGYKGPPVSFDAPEDKDGLKSLILVQERRGGRILGALRN